MTMRRKRWIGRWLISTLAWGPLLLWVVWPLLDSRFAWPPVVGYSSIAALLLNWAYTGWRGMSRSTWPALVATGVAFSVSYAVAARSGDVGTFVALSVGAGGLVSGIACGLIVVLAVLLAQVRDYGALEDKLLLSTPLNHGAMMAGVTVSAISGSPGRLVLGIAAGLLAGVLSSVWVLAWAYGITGLALSWAARRVDEREPAWWFGGS